MLSSLFTQLLDRRRFPGEFATGLGGLALASVLAEQGLLAADTPGGPVIRPGAPLGARTPPFAAKAKRVLHIFGPGPVSPLDTWYYKPALLKHDGKPLPGVEKLVTFQGENGNVARSPWEF